MSLKSGLNRFIKNQLASEVLRHSYIGNQDKDEAEKAIVYSFLQRVMGKAGRKARIIKQEKPDFKIIHNKKNYCLELTSFHSDSGDRGSEKIKLFKKWQKYQTKLLRN